MGDKVEFECWAWLSKRDDNHENVLFDASKFKKRKKRWLTVTDSSLIYSKSPKRSDEKHILLEHMTAIKTFNESNLETTVYLINSQTRTIQAVLEPDNFARDVPRLLSFLLTASSLKRRALTLRALLCSDLSSLKTILAYHTTAEAILQDTHFSPEGTPLQFVISRPALIACLPLVVDRDALMNCPNSRGYHPVHVAVTGMAMSAGTSAQDETGTKRERVAQEWLAVLKRLIEVGAWPCEQGGGGLRPEQHVNLRTSKCIAAEAIPTGSTGQAVSSGARPEVFDRSPLHLSEDEEITALLIQHGAAVAAQDSRGDTPLLLACTRALFLPVCELLDSGADINQAHWKTGRTPVMQVVCGHSPGPEDGADSTADRLEDRQNLFSEFMDRGVDLSPVDNEHMSVLHHSCAQGSLSALSAVLKSGATPDGQATSGATPLCLAACLQRVTNCQARAESHELCGMLLSKGSYPGIRDLQGRQALHYAAAAGNEQTLSLLLDVGHQDVNSVCFNSFTALDYINSTLAWLEEGGDRLGYFADMGLQFASAGDEEGRRVVRHQFARCRSVLKKHGAVERTRTDVSVEQNCRDIRFSGTKEGAYAISASTPFAALVRLTSCLFYTRSDAELLLLSYKEYMSSDDLLSLFKIRFRQLRGRAKGAEEGAEEGLGAGLGVVCSDVQLIAGMLSGDAANTATATAAATEHTLTRQSSLVLKRGNSTASSGPKLIKGVETVIVDSGSSIDDDDNLFTVQNNCMGKVSSGATDASVLTKLLECLDKCCDGLEMVSGCLVLRLAGTCFVLPQVHVRSTTEHDTSWSCELYADCTRAIEPLSIPGIDTSPPLITDLHSISLRCRPAHKMLRNKALYELQVCSKIPGDQNSSESLKDELCLLCAKTVFGLATGLFSPNVPLLCAPPTAAGGGSGASEGVSKECYQRQVARLENGAQHDRANTDTTSVQPFLQLLTMWCKDFYEDDFEHDSGLRYSMGLFVEEVFLMCGSTIEHEMDPNDFSPFLGLENAGAGAAIAADRSHDGNRDAGGDGLGELGNKTLPVVKQNKRESKAIRQSKRLSSQGLVETTPLLRGGMYESLFYFSQQNFFGENGVVGKATCGDFNLLDSNSEKVAEQWTLLEHFLFCKVKRGEFLAPEGKSATCSNGNGGAKSSELNLAHLKQFQWHMMDWSISQIIDSDTIETAQKKIVFFLDMAKCMEKYRNFNGMFEVYTVLQASSVYRLKEAWDSITPQHVQRVKMLKELFNPVEGFCQYRHHLLRLSQENEKDWAACPTVPYLGVYLKDLVHLRQLPDHVPSLQTALPSATQPPPLINMTKMTSVSAKLRDLHAFQRVAYRITPDFPLISQVFSKPRFKTEEDQYQGSIELAPLA